MSPRLQFMVFLAGSVAAGIFGVVWGLQAGGWRGTAVVLMAVGLFVLLAVLLLVMARKEGFKNLGGPGPGS
ncbi:hypothetical protein [Blastococcus saxobsidens]|uniref:Uncharacterized protein n=1 Tax=Blastococcus saxobsidens TaxID=138336 RepID=A0A4Q7YAK9_9ACTN|nr:hypothetical protein [Blastococcus saxobsidens]RZU33604.1 hypothetical protein BKA19_3336 [Blastococcus saxobsidens]